MTADHWRTVMKSAERSSTLELLASEDAISSASLLPSTMTGMRCSSSTNRAMAIMHPVSLFTFRQVTACITNRRKFRCLEIMFLLCWTCRVVRYSQGNLDVVNQSTVPGQAEGRACV